MASLLSLVNVALGIYLIPCNVLVKMSIPCFYPWRQEGIQSWVVELICINDWENCMFIKCLGLYLFVSMKERTFVLLSVLLSA